MTERITISLEPEIRHLLKDMAAQDRTTVSGVIKSLVKKTAEERQKEQSSKLSFSELIASLKVPDEILKSPGYKKYLRSGKAMDLVGPMIEEKHSQHQKPKRKKK